MMVSHTPVLKDEILQITREYGTTKIFCDCTLGEGGHTLFLSRSLEEWKFLGFDRDPEIIKRARSRLGEQVHIINDSYENFCSYPEAMRAGVFLLDLGISMFHYKESERGFTFSSPHQPLDMRYSPDSSLSAAEILNTYTALDLETMFMDNADIYRPGYFIEKIIQKRKQKPFQVVEDLLDIFPGHGKRKGIHPLTLMFQALRIEVNREFSHLEKFLSEMGKASRGTLFLFISYHSGEDRRIKHALRDMKETGDVLILNKRVIKPSWDERKGNRASRSAKLRAAVLK